MFWHFKWQFITVLTFSMPWLLLAINVRIRMHVAAPSRVHNIPGRWKVSRLDSGHAGNNTPHQVLLYLISLAAGTTFLPLMVILSLFRGSGRGRIQAGGSTWGWGKRLSTQWVRTDLLDDPISLQGHYYRFWHIYSYGGNRVIPLLWNLRPALPEKPKLLEIIRNDLCSYSSSDIPRVSYFDSI